MTRIARFTVNLEPEQVESLTRLAAESGLSASALVRNAISSGLRDPRIFMPLTPTGMMQRASAPHAVEATS